MLRLQWSVTLVTDEFIVPRLEDELIDELFYQEDEIGEMRHTAFMVECGLEEDPPDGPDVPPVPWGDMLLKQQQEQQEQKKQIAPKKEIATAVTDDDTDSDSDSDDEIRKKRELPNRSRSNDDIDTLAIELTSSPRAVAKKPPKRSNSTPVLVADLPVQSPSTGNVTASPGRENKRPARRVPVTQASSNSSPKRNVPSRGRLTKTRSGTSHEMASAAARARKKIKEQNAAAAAKDDDGPKYRKLTKTRSGTTHEMANAAAKARKKLDAEKAKKSPSVSERRKSIEANEQKNGEQKGRAAPAVRGLVATKSGTKLPKKKKSSRKEASKDSDDEDDSPRIVYKNGKRTVERRRSSISKESRQKILGKVSSHGSEDGNEKKSRRNSKKERSNKTYNSISDSSVDDDFLNEVVRGSDDESVAKSDISISTNESDSDDRIFTVPLKIPVRRRSVSTKYGSDDDHFSDDNSKKSTDTAKKKKKKKKKKKDGEIDDSSGHSGHSTKSLKKRKKKKDREKADEEEKEKEKLNGDTKDTYPSPSSIQNRKSFTSKQSPRMEPLKDNSSDPKSSSFYGSPSAIKAENKKRLSIPKSSLSIMEIEKQRQSQMGAKPDDFLGTDPLAAIKKKKEKAASPFSSPATSRPTLTSRTLSSPSLSSPKPDDWLGSGSKAKRSWRVKSKPAES